MGRPSKAAITLAPHTAKADVAARKSIEMTLRGKNDNIVAPDWLTDSQRKIFDGVVADMAASEILGNGDVYVLTVFAIAADHLFDIERLISEKGFDKDIIAARNSYIKDFWRGMNELSLDPLARAKISALRFSKEKEHDPLRDLLEGKR